MSTRFGCDMATFLDQGELNRVDASLGRTSFVGRYQPVYAMTPSEVISAHAGGKGILCVDNEDQNGSQMGGDFGAGYAHGQRAAGRWKALGAYDGVAVYLDVEQSFWVSPAYLAGFAAGVRSMGLVGGAYINSVAGNGHNDSYSAARGMTSAPILIFASEPQPFALAGRVADVWEPAAPAGHDGDVAVWQYNINYGASDLDLCNDLGWAHMWHASPPAPAVTTLTKRASLKSDPEHNPEVVADLAPGCVLHLAPEPSTDHDQYAGKTVTPNWAHVTVVSGTHANGKPAAGLQGWLLRADLRTTGG